MLIFCNCCAISEVPTISEALPVLQLYTFLLLYFCSCYSSYLEHSSLPTLCTNIPSRSSPNDSSCSLPCSLLQPWWYTSNTCQDKDGIDLQTCTLDFIVILVQQLHCQWAAPSQWLSVTEILRQACSWKALDSSDAGFDWRTPKAWPKLPWTAHKHTQLSFLYSSLGSYGGLMALSGFLIFLSTLS